MRQVKPYPKVKQAHYKSLFLLSDEQWRRVNERQCYRRSGVRCDPKYWNIKQYRIKQT